MASDVNNLIKEELRHNAIYIRQLYLKKPVGKGNVAVAQVQLQNNVNFCAGATSRAKSPTDVPKPKSLGGQFEPIIDSYSGRLMDTDAEYKLLSAIAETLEIVYNIDVEGSLYLYTELQPCESCQNILYQFQQKFPNLRLKVFWDYPYPPESS
jgi:hypothetical protein